MSKSNFPHPMTPPPGTPLTRRLLFAAALLLGACASFAQDAASPANEPVLASTQPQRELKQCIECHESYFTIADSKHFVQGDARTPKGSGKECDSCHGDTSEHNRKPRVKGLVPITYGSKAPAGPQNEQCLNCHNSGTRIHWQGSAHERTQQACASCHKAHTAKDPVMVAETQASVCFDCHKDRRAELHRLSTHPTRNGFFSCSSCHASHGSTAQRASLQKNTVNETCYTCHAQLRGPFLWEHRPAQDDCTNCHNPHGTNNPPMLKARQPFLCQQCHMTSGHTNIVQGGTRLQQPTLGQFTPNNSGLEGQSERIVGNACANCHMKVHGSNHPSGARLQR